jgi:hypothetical protein
MGPCYLVQLTPFLDSTECGSCIVDEGEDLRQIPLEWQGSRQREVVRDDYEHVVLLRVTHLIKS